MTHSAFAALAVRTALVTPILLTTVQARAAPVPEAERLRGTIVAADAASLTLHPASGADVKIMLGAGVHYAGVVASDLKAIQPGSFIGTATKGFGARMTALEVVVFPPELRGQGEGHYAWDKLPDPSGGGEKGDGGTGSVASSMTNGTVEANRAPLTSTSMTNGTIGAATTQAGGLHIAVAYKGGHKDIVVPADAPIVAFKVAGAEVVKKGAQAFVVAVPVAGGAQAKFVAVGVDGVKPPM